jgi:uracil DNA glycosylase
MRKRELTPQDFDILAKADNPAFFSDHPAAEGHNGGTSGTKFTGNNHFKNCNHLLKLRSQSIINW